MGGLLSKGIRIIILNAPPQSGKDEIAEYLSDNYGATHMEVKELLFQVAVRAAGISRPLWDALYQREYKEIPTPYLMINGVNVSPREWMIHCSEAVVKPTFGKEAFGNAAVQEVINKHLRPRSTVVFSDGGFIEEARPLAEYAQAVGGELVLARIERPGYGWGKDSRRYYYLEENGVKGREDDFISHEGRLVDCAEDIWEFANKGEEDDE